MLLLYSLPILAALAQVNAQTINWGEIYKVQPSLKTVKPYTAYVDKGVVFSSVMSKLEGTPTTSHAVESTSKSTSKTMTKSTTKITTTITTTANPKTTTKEVKHSFESIKATPKKYVVRQAAAGCALEPIMYQYSLNPNTAQQFFIDSTLNNISYSALPIPSYTMVFSNMTASVNGQQYLEYFQLASYNVSQCAAICSSISSCQAFNIYFERDPSVNPGSSCGTNPSALVSVRCALWGAPITSAQVTNFGEMRSQFAVLIQGSNGYNLNSPPAAISGFSGPSSLAGALNTITTISPAGLYFLSSNYTAGPYNPSSCSKACVAATSSNRQAANASSAKTYSACNYFDAFAISLNGTVQGTYCYMYTSSAAAAFPNTYSLTNANGVTFTISYSYGYALTIPDSGVISSSSSTSASLSTSYVVSSAQTASSSTMRTSTKSAAPTTTSISTSCTTSTSLSTSTSFSASTSFSTSTSSSTSTPMPTSTTNPMPNMIRGVNIGNWLILEPWMNSTEMGVTGAVDQWTFDQSTTNTSAALINHWQTWFTQADVALLSSWGFNTLRIPIGYWAYNNYNNSYFSGADSYLEEAIGWAATYGMKVMIDLHGAPGSQNGQVHSGHIGAVGWQTGNNMNLTIDVLVQIAQKYATPAYANTVFGIELTNEATWGSPNNPTLTKAWTQAAYSAVQAASTNPNLVIVMQDCYAGPSAFYWTGQALNGASATVNTSHFWIDAHMYLNQNGMVLANQSAYIDTACGWASGCFIPTQSLPVVVGEWSAGINLCAFGNGTTFGGTSCAGQADCQCAINTAPAAMGPVLRNATRAFVEAQLDVFEANTKGWFIWSYKGPGIWGLDNLVAAGIMPQPLTARLFPGQCGK